MVAMLFEKLPPSADSALLDPGCGDGAFIEGVLRWGQKFGMQIPHIVGVDSDPVRISEAKARIGSNPRVSFLEANFLDGLARKFDYVIGNPPYVSILGLSESERLAYRERFTTASGRFDLYTLFFEQAIRLLKPLGRLVFITPEKFTYVQSAARLRMLLTNAGLSQISLLPEDTFGDLVTYPAITTLNVGRSTEGTWLHLRDGTKRFAKLPLGGASWLPFFSDTESLDGPHVLSDAFIRISCGVATGADEVYVLPENALPDTLRKFAYPTISGRELKWQEPIKSTQSMLVPYSRSGDLLSEGQLLSLGDYLRREINYAKLIGRTCVSRKPWYAFHENPPLSEILRPKILCKDIAATPRFFIDEVGSILPRHSVYYLVPSDTEQISNLCNYLNSSEVARFLRANCQRAANGFIRLQSHVLKRIPLPSQFAKQSMFAYGQPRIDQQRASQPTAIYKKVA